MFEPLEHLLGAGGQPGHHVVVRTFPVTSPELSLGDAPIPLTAGHTVTRVLRTPQRCRSCGQWLSLDEDDLAALWEDPAAGVICWTCDQRDQRLHAVGP